MQTGNLAYLIDAATDERQTDPFAAAVAASIEVGVVVPSILRSQLKAAGFRVVEDVAALAEYGFASLATLERVVVTDGAGGIVAMGAAGDHAEAILHAALGWFREHPLPDAEIPPGIATAPTQPDESPAP